MNTAEKIYKTVQGLPEPMLHEVLDFAEFLQKKNRRRASPSKSQSETDDYFANPLVIEAIEAIERGKADIEAGRVTTIADPRNIWDSIQ
jgi:hypothetical protein